MKEQQNTWNAIITMPLFMSGFLVSFVRDSFVASNARHWVVLYLIALICVGVLMAYKHIIIWCYKKVALKYEKPFMEWAEEFRHRPMNIATIATVFGIVVPGIATLYVVVWSLLYLIIGISGLFNVLAAF